MFYKRFYFHVRIYSMLVDLCQIQVHCPQAVLFVSLTQKASILKFK